MASISNIMLGDVQISPPLKRILSLSPVKDSMIIESQPLLDYGDYNSLQVSPSNDGQYNALFGWDCAAIPAGIWSNVSSIKLILPCTGYHPDSNTINLYNITDNSWQEHGITWKGAPVCESVACATEAVVPNASDIKIDLTNHFQTNPGNTQFGFKVAATDLKAHPLALCSREYTTVSSRPRIEIEYYDYSVTPLLSSVACDITAAGYLSSDIACDIVVQSNNMISDIACDITIPKFSNPDLDIACDITVSNRIVSDIACDIVVEKQEFSPIDIACDISSAIEATPNDIACDITVGEITLTPVDINCDIDGAGKFPDTDIACDVVVEKQVLTPVDISGDITSAAVFTPTDISCDISVEKQAITPSDIACDITVQETSITDIACDIVVEKQVLTPVDISGDILAEATIISDIACDLTVVLPMPDDGKNDIICDINVIPAGQEDINCDITVLGSMTEDIACDMTVAQRSDSFITCDITVMQCLPDEIIADITVAAEMHNDMNCDITVLPPNKSSSYVYII